MKEKVLIIVHTVFVLFAYISPIWLDWRLVGLGALLYWIQILVFKACILSIAQYGNTETNFVGVYVNKFMGIFGKKIPGRKIKVFLDWAPLIVFVIALSLQNYLGSKPLVQIR